MLYVIDRILMSVILLPTKAVWRNKSGGSVAVRLNLVLELVP